MKEVKSIDDKKRAYECLAFIHQVMTQRTQFFLSEVDLAKASGQMITEMANRLADEIRALIPEDQISQQPTEIPDEPA
jgi:hypothetical protein